MGSKVRYEKLLGRQRYAAAIMRIAGEMVLRLAGGYSLFVGAERRGSLDADRVLQRGKSVCPGEGPESDSWEDGRQVLEAYAELNKLLQAKEYSDPAKAEILRLLEQLSLARSDESKFVRLRKIRGQLLKRPDV